MSGHNYHHQFWRCHLITACPCWHALLHVQVCEAQTSETTGMWACGRGCDWDACTNCMESLIDTAKTVSPSIDSVTVVCVRQLKRVVIVASLWLVT